MKIRCRHCQREAVIEKREDDEERLARQRWFVVETTWDEFYGSSYHMVCGGNDKKLFHELNSGFMKEVDSCVGTEASLHSAKLPYTDLKPGGYKQGWAKSKTIYHLFLPHHGDPPAIVTDNWASA